MPRPKTPYNIDNQHRAASSAILALNFKFEDMGIGGLDAEFSVILRRAFASRVFLPGLVRQTRDSATSRMPSLLIRKRRCGSWTVLHPPRQPRSSSSALLPRSGAQRHRRLETFLIWLPTGVTASTSAGKCRDPPAHSQPYLHAPPPSSRPISVLLI